MKNKIINKASSLFLALILILSLSTLAMAAGTNLSNEIIGNGTLEAPYEISTFDQLKEIPALGLNNEYILVDNITIPGGVDVWVPIGVDQNNAFTGSFDGNGYKITMGTADNPVVFTTSRYAGLFGVITGNGSSVNVKDLTVGGEIKSLYGGGNQGITGGIVAYIYGSGVIQGCLVSADITAEKDSPSGGVGGIVGQAGTQGNSGKISITGCAMTGNVMANGRNSTLGGIVGTNISFGGAYTITNCYSTGNVTAEGRGTTAGGIVGRQYNFGSGSGTIAVSQCYSTGNISVDSKNDVSGGAGDILVGGVVGWNYAAMGNPVTLVNCYSTGDISLKDPAGGSRNYVGGITGENYGDFFASATISHCYATGTITLDGSGYIGGIAGRNSGGSNGTALIENSVALNKEVVSESATMGRVVGNNTKTLANNFGLESMNGGAFSDDNANGLNGIGVSILALQTAAGWPTGFLAEPWTFKEGKLPILANTGGLQNAEMPGHLSTGLRLTTETENVKAGEEFTLSAYFAESVNSNAAILEFAFDTEKFSYIGFSPANGVSLLHEEENASGVTITVMVDDYETGVYGDIKLAARKNAILAEEDNEISVTAYYVLKYADGTKEVMQETASTVFGTVPDKPGFEWDGIYNLINLSNLIDLFGMTGEDEGWDNYKVLDFNENNEIDINDIATFASRIGK